MFTKIGKLIAIVVAIFGAFLFLSGILFASSSDPQEMTRHYYPSKTSGELIDRGIYQFAIGIFMGVLCEISQKLSARREETTKSDKG